MKKYVMILKDPELIDKLQCSDYLLSGKKDILISILSNPEIDINDKLFNKYCDDYIKSYIYNEECKVYLQTRYISPFFSSYEKWSLEYLSSKLMIVVDEATLSDEDKKKMKDHGFMESKEEL